MELFLSPVLNLFIILIPFLLITAVFVQTSVIDLFLPTFSPKPNPESKSQQKVSKETLLILSIAPQGFSLIMEDRLMIHLPREKDFTFDRLGEILHPVRKKFPRQKSIIIEPDDSILYDDIIHIMDQCRASGLVNITLTAVKN